MANNKKSSEEKRSADELLIGRNPIIGALSGGRPIIKIMIAKGQTAGHAAEIAAKAGIPIQQVERKKLDCMTSGAVHQGVAALCAVKEYATVDDILRLAEERNEAPFIILLDEIEDPHNLGAIIRSAECAGAHGVIIKKRHAAGLTYTAYKAAAGALEYVPVARVNNLSEAIDQLKQKNIWVYGADMNGEDYLKTDFSGAVALAAKCFPEKCGVITSTPVRILHGEKDSVMDPTSVKAAVEVINDAGGQCELTIYPGEGHMIQQHYMDDGGAIVAWLTAQHRDT